MDWKFEVGQLVRKTGGYPFPGVVEVRFMATQIDGTAVERYVVNQLAQINADEMVRPTGLLHIFAPAQLKADNRLAPEHDNGEAFPYDVDPVTMPYKRPDTTEA